MTSINPIYNINYAQAPNLKTKAENISTPNLNPISNPNFAFKGTEALRAYNYNLIDKNNIPTLELINTEENFANIEGTPIYSSNGELVAKESYIGENRYLYHNDKDKTIEIFDKDGNLIKEQYQVKHSNEEKMIFIKEFVDGEKNYYQSAYRSENNQEFELVDNSKTMQYPDGSMKKDTYMIENKNYLINESNLDSNRMLLYDENKKLISVSENNSKGHFKKSINYYNNIPYQIEENNYKTISNNISEELDILSDEKLKPHPRFNFHPKANEIEGEKTFYSNGNIETNTFIQDGKEVKYHFLPNGKIKSVVLNNIIVENGKNKGISYYSIKEIFPDNAEKETTYFTDTNNALVKYTDNNTEKYINYSNNKIRTCHYRKNNNIYLYNFDNKGNLSNFQEITDGKTS